MRKLVPNMQPVPKEEYEEWLLRNDASKKQLALWKETADYGSLFSKEPVRGPLIREFALCQRHYTRENYGKYGGTLATAGCPIFCCYAIIRSFYPHYTEVTISHLKDVAVNEGYRTYYLEYQDNYIPNATRNIYVYKIPERYDLKVVNVPDPSIIPDHLKSGHLFVVLTNNATFFDNPKEKDNHFMVVYGISGEEFLCYDPRHQKLQKYKIERVLRSAIFIVEYSKAL